jgi:hypothetical protein
MDAYQDEVIQRWHVQRADSLAETQESMAPGTGCAARGFTGSFPLCSGSRVASRVQPDSHGEKEASAGFPGHEPERTQLAASRSSTYERNS